MKTRTRSSTVEVFRPIKANPTGITYGGDSLTSEKMFCEESITWEPAGGRKAYHWCQAIKHNYQASAASLRGEGSYVGVYRIRNTDGNVSFEPLSSELRYAGSGPSLTVTCGPSDDEVADAISSASVRLSSLPIRPMMNLPQAIIELKDIPRTLKAVPRLARWLRGAGARKGYSLGDSVKEVASGYLAYVFGVRPTANDVESFMGTVPERVGVGVRQMRYKAGEPVRAAFTVKDEATLSEYKSATTSTSGWQGWNKPALNSFIDVAPVGSWNGNSTAIASKGVTRTKDWPWLARYQVKSREVVGVVFGKVARDYSHDFSWMDDMKISADPISTGWELVPFSFVVDWFADLGRWLRDMNRLSAARYSGFSLENGIWVSKRDTQVTYLPVCDFYITGHWEYRSGESYPCRFYMETTKVVHMERYIEEVSYTRNVLTDRVVFPRLGLKGLSQQGAFQWASGTALAIQACAGLK